MSNQYIDKNITLTLEFDRYLASHPNAYNKIPKGSCVVITKEGDSSFNKVSQKIAEGSSEKCVEAHKVGRNWIIRSLGQG